MNKDNKMQDMILENERLKKRVETLQLQIRSRKAGCACYKNAFKEPALAPQKKEN